MSARPVLAIASFVLLLASSLAAGGQPLEGFREEEASTGKVYWRGWSDEDRREVLDLLPRALSRIESRLGRRLDVSFTTVLVPDGFELRRIAERLLGEGGGAGRLPPEVVGLAIPSLRVLLVRGNLYLRSTTFQATLGHEVAHLVIHRLPSARVPRWFDEGTATWLSDPFLSPDAESYLAFLARIGGLYRLESLDEAFPGGHEPASIAYGESLLFIRYLAERHGEAAIPRILDLLEAGADGAGALEAVASRPTAEVEEDFHRWVAGRASLLDALGSVVSLWTLIGLLALLAIIRYLLRRRRRRESLGDGDLPRDEPPEEDLKP